MTTTPKLKHILSIICGNLSEKSVPHTIIGAMALAFYGVPRFTADIDILSEEPQRETILHLMKRLGYQCFQDTGDFAQFDSELGVYGKVDFMFVRTDDGRAIIERSISVKDDLIGTVPVVQPSDYAVLKLMAVANNPDRRAHDMADLETLFKSVAAGFLNPAFDPMNIDQLQKFADQFHVSEQLKTLLPLLDAEK